MKLHPHASPVSRFLAFVFLVAVLTVAAGARAADPCIVPDNGSGTVYLPPVGCQYLNPTQVHMITNGLPPGTTIELAPIHKEFICRQGGGLPCSNNCFSISGCNPAAGETEQFGSTLQLGLKGTGLLAGWTRTLSIPGVQCLVQSQPRTPFAPVQSFDTVMQQLQGQLPPGDPDFDLLRITAGTGFGMPSPGHTTLTRQPSGSWAVDSFFDVNYRIDFIGHPGSTLGGMSGSTTGTIRMSAAPPPAAPPPEHFFTSVALPPPNGMYVSPQLYHQLYTNGIIISNIIHRRFLQSQPPPPPGGPAQVHNFGSQVQMLVSMNNGATFTPVSAPAQVSVRVTPTSAAGDPAQTFDTEMLQLDITGGTLPAGVMVRESPSKASLGKTTVRTIPGGAMIGSFFDVFTELSLDGGASWVPAVQSAHVELRGDPVAVPSIPAPSRLLPPPNDLYISPALYHILLANGIVIKDIKHRYFTQSLPAPTAANPTALHHFDSQVDMSVSQDGGLSFSFVRAPAAVDVSVTLRSSFDGTEVFDTEMLALSIQGGDLPLGMMLRESPTRASQGGTAIEPLAADGTRRIHSFFDIWPEVTVDGGATWTPATQAARVELVCNAPEVPKPTPNLPPLDGSYISPQQFHILTAQGIIISNVSHRKFSQTFPPPVPLGVPEDHNFNSEVEMDIVQPGQPVRHVIAPALVTVRLTHTRDDGATSFFDTEMLALNISGGTLPAGVMVRESPTKASLGRTSIRMVGAVPPIWDYISSFFDVFTELTVDGGATWQPAVSEPATMTLAAPCAVSIVCPASITVNASGPAGTVVNYPAPTVTANCPPVTTACNPPTGSTFPIGTTTVTCTTSDGPGNAASCTFKVTVRRPKPGFFPNPVLPPTNGVYITPTLYHQLFNNGIIIRDIKHRRFTGGQPPPPAGGQPQIHSFGSIVELEHSMDGGVTFQKVSAPANCTVRVSLSSAINPALVAATQTYDTEMLALDISGGSLPAGVMIRESPTLASTGQTTVRQVGGGFMIDSFFDVFTEISLDGGGTWSPAVEAAHVELRPDIALVTPIPAPTRLLPPRNDAYISPAQFHILAAQGIVIKDVRHSFFTLSQPPPPAGGIQIHQFDSQVDMMLSQDGGNTFTAVRAPAAVTVEVEAIGSADSGLYDTEMLALNLQGGGLPAGVMIRESPTEPSRGSTQITPQADGTYRIGSFFDIFTEVSLNGGQTWLPAQGPAHVELICDAPEQVEPSPNLPPLDGQYISPQKYHQLYASGIIISNISHKRFLQNEPPPPPGGSQTHQFGSEVEFDLIRPGQATLHLTAPAGVNVMVRSSQDEGSTRYFDTEMLALNISGGGLPAAVMVRESPSKASLGRTSIRQVGAAPPIWDYISSFFDVFTELSTDGGATWSPAVGGPGHVVLTPLPNPTNCATITCPSNIVIWTCSPNGAVVTYTVGASNVCGGTVSVSCTRPSGSTFPVGVTNVTCTATALSVAGLPIGTATCSFTVTVILDTQNPRITCPTNMVVWTCSPNGTVVNYNAPATDDCDPNPVVTCTRPSGTTFPPGTNVVTCTARDTCGHQTNCTFTVIVRVDTQPPQLTCPSNVIVRTCGDREVATYTVTATDDCDPAPGLVCNPPSGSVFPLGTNLVTCIASDSCGHKRECTFPVIVIQEPLPKLVVTVLPGGRIQFCWRTPCPPGEFKLWCTRSLNAPILWEQVTIVPTCDASGQCCITLTNSLPTGTLGQRFYRLRRAGPTPTFSTVDTLPPAGVFSSPPGDLTLFANGVQVRWFTHRVLPPPNPLPPCATCPDPIIFDFQTTLDVQYSTDGGRTFLNASVPNVTTRVQVFGAGQAGLTRSLNMEMVSLNAQGGTLPAGVMVRESPTLASTGKHVIRTIDGGFMIESFFDVFLELSVNGGQTWIPANAPVHVDYSTTPPEQFSLTDNLPPVGDYNSLPGVLSRYGNGVVTRWIVHRIPPLPCPPACPRPPPCLTCPPDILAFPTVIDLQYSADGGQTFNQVSLNAQTRVRVAHISDTSDTRVLETELLSFDFAGAPAGVMLRESPTLPSKGKTTVRQIEGGSMISSFFDVFTEISLDGGQNWSPVVNPTHVEYQPSPPPVPEGSDNFPPIGSYNSVSNTPARFSNGLIARRFSHQVIPPFPIPPRPPPCLQCPPETYDFPTLLSWQFSTDGGVSFQNGSAQVTTSVRARQTMVDSDRRFFDTEMLVLQTPAGLPGVMIRESPSKASLGKTSIRQGPQPSPWLVASFFDVFLELSTDGGATWSSASNPIHVELNPQPFPP